MDNTIRQIVADAERYRWLRRRDLGVIGAGGIFAGMTPDNVVLNGADLDRAIDAARGEAAIPSTEALAPVVGKPVAWLRSMDSEPISDALKRARTDGFYGHHSIPLYVRPATDELTDAARDVLAERRRQVDVEGWTPEHDDQHLQGALGRAAGLYALNAGVAQHFGTHDTSICDTPDSWPWAPEWWKPLNARRDLVKAGALILAEIERIDRAAECVEAGK